MAGNDKAYGGDGDDNLVMGPGDDGAYGEDDNDRLAGGGGNDLLDGAPRQRQTSRATPATTSCSATTATTTSTAAPATTTSTPGRATTSIMLGAGNDVGHGGDGNDGDTPRPAWHPGPATTTIYGEPATTTSPGGAGNDHVVRRRRQRHARRRRRQRRPRLGPGDDNATGDEGDDTMLPGDGADFVYAEEGYNHVILTSDGAKDLVYCRHDKCGQRRPGYVTYVGSDADPTATRGRAWTASRVLAGRGSSLREASASTRRCASPSRSASGDGTAQRRDDLLGEPLHPLELLLQGGVACRSSTSTASSCSR